MQVTRLQLYTYKLLMCGYSAFVCGEAGTGKTHIVKKFIKDIRKKGYNVMLLAPTGLAANNIGGVTIHREFGLDGRPIIADKSKFELNDSLLSTDVIVIDEISMCRIDLFDFLGNQIIRANKKRRLDGKPDIQFVVVGDFFQLPPVAKRADIEVLNKHYKRDIGLGYCFNSVYWKMFNFKVVMLTEIIRQDNFEFQKNLNSVRAGDKSAIEWFIQNSSKSKIDGAIEVCGKNSEVLERNNSELEKLLIAGAEKFEFRAEVTGEADISECIADEVLEIAVGCRVMTLINKDGYVNGSFGTFLGLDGDSLVIKLDSGLVQSIEKYEWNVFKYELDTDGKLRQSLTGTITQYPVKLAYAVTIHKSQGQTYSAANLSPYCWDCGQLYTALSRVRDIKNLHLNYEIDRRYLVLSLNVVKFHNEIVNEANKTVRLDVDLRKVTEVKTDYSSELNKIIDMLNK